VTLTADAVVIGAGVIGASTAFELAQTGRVLFVDKLAGSDQGSTSASSAVVRLYYSTRDGVTTAWESKHHWTDWPGHLEGHPAGEPLATFPAWRSTGRRSHASARSTPRPAAR